MDLYNAENSGRIIVGAISQSRLFIIFLLFFSCTGKTVKRVKTPSEPVKIGILGFTSVKKTLSSSILEYAGYILEEELIKKGRGKIYIIEKDLFKKMFLSDTSYNYQALLAQGFKYLIKGVILVYEENPGPDMFSRVEVMLRLIDVSSGRIIFSEVVEKTGRQKREKLLKKTVEELIIKLINFLKRVQIPR